jgi:hypothetical protein
LAKAVGNSYSLSLKMPPRLSSTLPYEKSGQTPTTAVIHC